MGILDGLLGQLGNIEELAGKLGLPADQVQALVSELPAKLSAGGNPIEALTEVAGKFGISADQIQGLLGQFGGGANPLEQLGDMAKGFFGGD